MVLEDRENQRGRMERVIMEIIQEVVPFFHEVKVRVPEFRFQREMEKKSELVITFV